MFKTYLYTAFRSLWKNKAFTVLNILGLSIGICAALVIYLMVSWDFSFERAVPDHKRIYRVVSNFISADDRFYNCGVNVPLVNAIPTNITGLEEAAPLRSLSDMLKVSVNPGSEQKAIFKNQEGFIYTYPSYFKILPYQWLSGTPDASLSNPNQVVLTTESADKYFPGIPYEQLAGKQLYLEDTLITTVSGIVKTRTDRTDFRFIGFLSYSTLTRPGMQPHDWNEWDNTTNDNQILVKLPAGTSPAGIERQVTGLFRKNFPRDLKNSDDQFYTLQPLTEIHFDGRYGNFDHRLANKNTLYGLLTIAGFLLLLGCINFINLTTAQSSTRAKEIGIRKTMGSSKKQLIVQFMGETFLLTLLATVLSCLLTPLALRLFADFIPPGIQFPATGDPGIWIFLAAMVLVVSFLSGIYPALVLSGFRPVQVLKNYSSTGNAHTRRVILRKSLTVSQFVVAQVFIVATLLVSKQVSYTLNKDIGIRKDAIVFIRTPWGENNPQKRELLAAKLRAIPEIAMVSIGGHPPASRSIWTSTIKYVNGQKEIEASIDIKVGDSNYVNVYQLPIVAGRNTRQSDTLSELLINQTYAKLLGFSNPADAVGITLSWDDKNIPVAGVVHDFNQKTLHEAIRPLAISNQGSRLTTMHVLLHPQNADGSTWKNALAKAEQAFKSVYPDLDYKANFFDESLANAYESEQKTSRLMAWTAGLAILISCLGLLGLVTFTTVQRTKEIGVRKVLGASVTQIVTMLSKDIIALVAIALLIAIPLAWIGLHQWLQQFAYRTNISWWLFLVTGGLTILVALVTLSLQTIRAALADPVKSLRSE
ncbi:MAG: FtsX-like permease family protein [Pseudobacter sp.]|uniref:FtsX-like permease family protein n=1 Tax=Pseudobacter sp. TaxID=2045420 RepID=UPI003F7CD98E